MLTAGLLWGFSNSHRSSCSGLGWMKLPAGLGALAAELQSALGTQVFRVEEHGVRVE